MCLGKKSTVDTTINGVYYILDNGTVPYKVVVTNGTDVAVHRNVYTESDETTFADTPFTSFIAKRVFIGCSPLNKMTSFSGGHGSKFDGNTVLLQVQSNKGYKYVYIGSKILSFMTECAIVEYVSPMGNSCVPYPYAVNASGEIYLFASFKMEKSRAVVGTMLLKTKHSKKFLKNYDDPYEFYYDAKDILGDTLNKRAPLIPNFGGISKFYIGRRSHDLSYYDGVSKKRYLRGCDREGRRARLYVKYIGHKHRTRLPWFQFRQIMMVYAQDMGFSKFAVHVLDDSRKYYEENHEKLDTCECNCECC